MHNTSISIRVLLLTLALVALAPACRKGPVHKAPDGHRFVVQLVGDYPAKFHNQRIGVRAEGILVKDTSSREPLQTLEFTMDRDFMNRALAEKSGPDADRLEVTIRLEPLDRVGRETEFVVIFNIEQDRPLYEVMLGANPTPDDNPVKSEDTDQSSKIN